MAYNPNVPTGDKVDPIFFFNRYAEGARFEEYTPSNPTSGPTSEQNTSQRVRIHFNYERRKIITGLSGGVLENLGSDGAGAGLGFDALHLVGERYARPGGIEDQTNDLTTLIEAWEGYGQFQDISDLSEYPGDAMTVGAGGKLGRFMLADLTGQERKRPVSPDGSEEATKQQESTRIIVKRWRFVCNIANWNVTAATKKSTGGIAVYPGLKKAPITIGPGLPWVLVNMGIGPKHQATDGVTKFENQVVHTETWESREATWLDRPTDL